VLDPRALDAGRVEARLLDRRIKLRRFYNGAIHQAMHALPGYIRETVG
jgi:hypothetical protein